MSLINRMLRELDKRHAQAEATSPAFMQPPPLAQSLRPVKGVGVGSDMFWWVIAGIMVVAIAWLVWVMWQLSPRSVVNEVALRPFPTSPAGRAVHAMSQDATVPGPADQLSGDLPASSLGTFTVRAGVDMLKLATEITTPIPVRPRPSASTSASRQPGSAASGSMAGTASVPESLAGSAPVGKLPPSPQARPAASATPQDKSGIDKRVPATAREQAESEYRRAVILVNQGRVSEGMEALRNTLAIDSAYEPARQTLVALLVEQRRMDEAAAVLQEGLNMHPANSDFAMLLARILVDRQDVSGALAVLQRYAPAAGTRADYHGFAAALHQRMGQHREAMDEYHTALRLSPQSAVWWVGLGISQEAADRRKEALESFRRARASGNLNSELRAYVDQRLRQLQ